MLEVGFDTGDDGVVWIASGRRRGRLFDDEEGGAGAEAASAQGHGRKDLADVSQPHFDEQTRDG